jgi:serine/threonine protein phosphatase PrpC
VKFLVGAVSDVGKGRSGNEDRFLVDLEHDLYAVADGMGGHRAGEVASATAIESLQGAYQAGAALDEAVGEANAAVFAKASANVDMRGMGTTLTAVALRDGRTALLGHVGDSRAYLMRDGGVTQVTDDHSLVEQLVREGRLSPEEALHHPQRAIITRALGVDPDVEVDTYRVDLRPGDRIVLCSDGLTNMVADDSIAAVLRGQSDPQQAAERLVDMANDAGGDDNITVVILEAVGDSAAEGMAASASLGPARAEEATGEWVVDQVEGEGEGEGEADEPVAPPASRQAAAPAPAPKRQRRLARPLLRALAWALPVLVVVGVAFGAVGWYARRTFYVGLTGDQVTLFRGVPGGLLGWAPTVERRSDLRAGDLDPADRSKVENSLRFSDRSKALGFLNRLEVDHQVALEESTTTTTPDGVAATGSDSSSTTPSSR